MKAQISYEGKLYASMPDLNRDDVGQLLTFNLLLNDDGAVDLSTASVDFKMKQINSTGLKVNQSCALTSPASGVCAYTTQSGDLDTEGVFDAELEVTDGTQVTTVELGRFRIIEDLA